MKRFGAVHLPRPGQISQGTLRQGRLLLLGTLTTLAVLLLYQINWQSVTEQVCDRWFERGASAYPYPFEQAKTQDAVEATLYREMAFYQERLRVNPSSALDLGALAGTYLQTARLTGEGSWYLLAEQTAQQSLASLPFDNPGAMAILARVAEARHDFVGALKLASQIPDEREAVSIRATAYLALGQLPAAAQAAQQLVDWNPGLGAYTTQALVQAAQGQNPQALESFAAALKVEAWGEVGSSARTRTLLGRFAYEQGQIDQARDLYQAALRILPDYPPALLNLAQLRIRQGQYRAAEKLYHRLETAQQGRFTTYTPLRLRGQARIAQLQGHPEVAQQLWQQAETLLLPAGAANDPPSLGHRRDLARLLLERQGPGDRAKAVAVMAAEVRLRQDAETLQVYASTLAQSQRWREARPLVQQALATGVQNASLFDLAGQIEQALDHPASAAAYFRQATGVDPSFDDAARHALDLGSGLGS